MLTRRQALVLPAAAALRGQSPQTLNAGPLSIIFEPTLGFVRYVRFGEHEVLRGIYAAVRDSVWGTVSPKVSNLVTEIRPDAFKITFDVDCQQDDINFHWQGSVTGTAAGVLRFGFDGEARSTFKRNRLGFAVLHPLKECAGKACVVEKSDGSTASGFFPRMISPHQPFMDMKAISHQLPNGATAEVRFEGEVFEMEDHRNWTDGNYKTYCTPLALPFPVEVKQGTRVQQAIVVTVKGGGGAPAIGKPRAEVVIAVEPKASAKMPTLGLGMAGRPITPAIAAKLGGFSHLRADVDLSAADWRAKLERARKESVSLGAALELAVHVADPAQLAMLKGERALRWLVFKQGDNSAKPATLKAARENLVGAIAGGTNTYFTELNRERPAVALLDLTCYSINPQVHAFDDTSLVENLEPQGDTLRTCRTFIGAKPIAISPVTLRPRFNPQAKPPQPPIAPDPRQASAFCAAWTLGSVKYLAESGAASVTYYETHGAGGLLDDSGAAYPVHGVLARLLPYQEGTIFASSSADPLKAVALVVEKGKRRLTMVANLTGAPLIVRCPGTTANGLIPLLPHNVQAFDKMI